jgi:hypothetical protein
MAPSPTRSIWPPRMDTDFALGEDIDRIAKVAAALRELDADLPLAEALEAQVAILEEAQERYA